MSYILMDLDSINKCEKCNKKDLNLKLCKQCILYCCNNCIKKNCK